MKNQIIFLAFIWIIFGACQENVQSVNLYNGNDLSGWHLDVPEMDTNDLAPTPFIANGNTISTLGSPGGHLITDKQYSNYRLSVTYRFTDQPGNCGLLVHASTPRALYDMFPKSIESQMMHENAGDFWVIREDIVCDDMIERRGPKEKWGSKEGDNRRIPNLTDDSENLPGQWNTMVVECFEKSIKVWVNGDLVNYGYDCTASKGNVALQSEGSAVDFKDIVLTPITALTL